MTDIIDPTEPLERPRDPLGALDLREPLRTEREPDVLRHDRHHDLRVRVAEHERDAAAVLSGIRVRVEAEHPHVARVATDETREHPRERGLS